jgi:DNA processing protein
VEKSLNDYKYWLTLGRNVRFTASLFNELFALNMPISSIFELTEGELRKQNLSEKCIREFISARRIYKPERVLSELEKNQIEPVFYFEKDYPELLRQTYCPPFILYKKGSGDLNQFCIGIVGSRRPTDYGIRATEKLAGDLAANGVCVVSGLALGLDAVAHQAAMTEGGSTIAVVGSGLNVIYPSTNVAVAKEIVDSGGAIISEYPFDTHPTKYGFPARNRLISGISQGLLVTEAAAGSGSLITAKMALDQNREVFAVPGSIFNLNSAGTNNLISAGAHVATSAQDIFDEFGISHPEIVTKARKIKGDDAVELAIIDCLEIEPKHIDIIVKETGLSQSDISAAITLMEISAKLKHLGSNVYRLNN